MDKIEKYFSALHNLLKDNNIEFQHQLVLQGISVDFYLHHERIAIIITEKEHDHGESYYAEMEEIKHLSSCGFSVIQLPLPNFEAPQDMATELFRQMRL